jgi:cytochrome b6-f complex iron-sulfur subunit
MEILRKIFQPDKTRRDFLKITSAVALAGAIAGHLWIAVRYLTGSSGIENRREWKVGSPDKFSDGITFVTDARIFILRERNRFRAFSAKCTHLGCTLKKIQPDLEAASGKNSGIEFHCPCHGSKFNASGERIAGPAQKPMQYMQVTLSSNRKELLVNNNMPVDSDYFLEI